MEPDEEPRDPPSALPSDVVAAVDDLDEFLYHVHEEMRPDGDQHLHWEFLRKIRE